MGAMDAERLARLLAGKIGALPAAYVAEIEAFIDSVVERAGILGDWKPWRPVSFDREMISVGDTLDADAAFYRLAVP